MKRISLSALLLVALSPTFLAAQEPVVVPAAPAAPVSVNIPLQGFADEVEKLLPAVVNISTTQTIKDGKGNRELPDFPEFPPGSPLEDFFKDFMEKHKQAPNMPRQRKTTSLGSGFIIDQSGYIVTNNHVIQDADEITVILHDETNLKATVVGRDNKTDLAVLKVTSSKPLPAVAFGDSDKMRVGDWILVIGNPFGLGGTVTTGIISARSRDINSGPYDDYMQTDAPINRGNSGGPMFNLKGEVIGINTAIFSPTGGSVGIGFAIPSSMAKTVVEQLKTGNKIKRGWLGVRIQNVTEEIAKSLNLPKVSGALVSSLSDGSPAGKAGVKPGDVILTFDGKPVTEMRRLPRMVAEAGINKNVPTTVWRDGKEISLNVTVGELKDEEKADGVDGDELGDEEAPIKQGKTTPVPEYDIKVAPLADDTRKSYEISDKVKGIVITAIGDNSPLIDKGLVPGDVISEAGQKEVKDVKDFLAMAKDAAANKRPLLLLIDRKGDLRFVAANAIDPAAKKKEEEKAK